MMASSTKSPEREDQRTERDLVQVDAEIHRGRELAYLAQ